MLGFRRIFATNRGGDRTVLAPGVRAWPIAGFFRYRELFFRILKWNVLCGDLLVAVVAMSIDKSVDLWHKHVSTRNFSIQ